MKEKFHVSQFLLGYFYIAEQSLFKNVFLPVYISIWVIFSQFYCSFYPQSQSEPQYLIFSKDKTVTTAASDTFLQITFLIFSNFHQRRNQIVYGLHWCESLKRDQQHCFINWGYASCFKLTTFWWHCLLCWFIPVFD